MKEPAFTTPHEWRCHRAKHRFIRRDSWARYQKRAASTGLICQECHGEGGWVEVVCELGGPWCDCAWCCGGGYVIPRDRAMWLNYMKHLKRDVMA